MVSKKIEELVDKFLTTRIYLTNGAGMLAERWGVSRADIYEARDEARRRMKAEQATKCKRLFFDIETSPNVCYVWETGYKIRVPHNTIIKERQIMCISYKWWGEDKVHNIWWKNQDDRNVLEEFLPIIFSADEVVAHNGDRFDIPMLLGRAAYHRLKAPTKYRTFDTYKKIKAQFKLNSYSLDYCTKFFNVRGKMETGGFDLWKDILQNDDKKKRKAAKIKMIDYCNRDVIAMEDLYNTIQPYTKAVTNMSVLQGGENWACPSCGSKEVSYAKPDVTPRGITQRHMECNTCGNYYHISSKAYFTCKEYQKINK